MKQYMLFFITSLHISTTLHSASTMLGERDKKYDHATTVFWENINLYNTDARFDRMRDYYQHKRTVLNTIDLVLTQNPHVLQTKHPCISTKHPCISTKHPCISTEKPCTPLYYLACLASKTHYDRGSHEWQTFANIARLDTDNDRRLSVIELGIDRTAVSIVQEMLAVGTNVSNAQGLLPRIVNRCHTRIGKPTELLQMTSLLLRSGVSFAQLKTMTNYNAHFQSDAYCVSCPLIAHHIRQQELLPMDLHPECDRKLQNQFEQGTLNSKPFWANTKIYSDQATYNNPTETVLETLLFMLKSDPRILATRSLFQTYIRTGFFEWHPSKIPSCSPLLMAAVIALNQLEKSPEYNFFQTVALLDTDNDRRLEVIDLGIEHTSFPLVQQILTVGTDVTQSPKPMAALMESCATFRGRYTKKYYDHNLVEKILGVQSNYLIDGIAFGQNRLLGITHLLLDARANLTGVAKLIEQSHVTDGTCFGCNLVKESVDNPSKSITQLPKPSAPSLYPSLGTESSSSSISQSSSSSSSCSSSSSSISASSLSSTITPGEESSSAKIT